MCTFDASKHGHREKINCLINCCVVFYLICVCAEILSSKKYNSKQRQYRLFAVVYHDGKEASKGHYITDVYHTGYLNWIRYDDSTVKRVSEKQVLHPHTPRVPYLLYYQRIDTLPAQANTNTNVSNAHTHSK